MDETLESTDRTWAAMAHALALVGYVVPFVNLIAPLIIYLTRGKESELVSEHARESLNFQLTQLVLSMVFAVLAFVGVGCLLLVVQMVFEVICVVRASLAARDGRDYLYPLTLRIV
jgi:uncharacterized protein